MLENKYPTKRYNQLVPPPTLPVREMPVPASGIFDSAAYVFPAINPDWMPYIVGRLHELADEQRWEGTDSDKWHARQQIEEFLSSLEQGNAMAFSGAKVYRNSTLSVNNGTPTAVPMQAELYDTGDYWSAGAADRFVITGTGYYRIALCVRWNYGGFNSWLTQIYKNGVTLLTERTIRTDPNFGVIIPAITQEYLEAGDYINFVVYQAAGANLEIASGRENTFAEIQFLGE
jgi:hypothetical protein